MEKHYYEVSVSGFICVEAKDEYDALKVARNWSHKVITETEGETYDYDLSKVRLLHIESDEHHVTYVNKYLDDKSVKAKAYWKSKIVPFLPKKMRDLIASESEYSALT